MSKVSYIITDAAKLTAAIQGVNKSSNKLANDIQIVLVSASYHAVAHGNIQPLFDLMAALGKGVRKTAVADWTLKFCPVLMNSGKDKADKPFVFSREKLIKMVGDKPTLEVASDWADLAYKTMWTDLKEPPLVPESFDLGVALQRMVKHTKDLQGKGVKIVGEEFLAFVERLTQKPETPVGDADPLAS